MVCICVFKGFFADLSRNAGSKPDLVEQLASHYIAATEAGLSPEAYRTRQLEAKRKPSKKITPKTDIDDAMENWSLAQLRQAVQEKGMRPKGTLCNKKHNSLM